MKSNKVVLHYFYLWLMFFLMVVACAEIGLAQSPSAQATPAVSPSPTPVATASPASPSLERQFLKNTWHDQEAIWTSPFRLHGKDARWLAPLGISTAALIITDRRTAGWVSNNQTQQNVSYAVSQLGAGYTTYGIAAGFYLIGRATKNTRARETGLLGLEALIDSTIVVTALKEVTQRPRPLSNNGRGRFFTGGNSFPSGHAISTWSLATVVAEEYHDRPAIRYTVYALAAAVSISRYTDRKHFLSDVLVGSALGYGIGKYVYRTHHVSISKSTDDKNSPKTTKLFPMISPIYAPRTETYGMRLAWNF